MLGVSVFLVAYPVLYFLPSVQLLLSGASLDVITTQRLTGSSPAMKGQALFALVIVAGRIFYLQWGEGKNPFHGVGCWISILLLVTGLWTHSQAVGIAQIINIFGLSFMLATLPLAGNAWVVSLDKTPRFNIDFFVISLFFLTSLAVFLSYFELVENLAWARFIGSNGELVKRASAFMFNPNLLALWCCIMAAIFSFVWQAQLASKRGWLALLGVFVAGLGIFLSSSRSQGYLLLLTLIGTALLLPAGHMRRWQPTLAYTASIVFSVIFVHFQLTVGHQDTGTQALAVLSNRMVGAPEQLLAAILRFFPEASDAIGLSLQPEAAIAFDGRFHGEGRDSTLLAAFDDAGLLGAISLSIFWVSLAYLGIRSYFLQRSVYTAHALSMVGFVIVAGVFMRHQVFPVWLFMLACLSPCVALWRGILLPSSPKLVWI